MRAAHSLISFLLFLAATTLCTLPVLASPDGLGDQHRAKDAAFERRRAAIWDAMIAAPWPNPECLITSAASPCVWGKISLAIAKLSQPNVGGKVEGAVRTLEEVIHQLPKVPGWKRRSDPSRPETSDLLDPSRDFPFLTATLLFRVTRLFGRAHPNGLGLLPQEAEQHIKELFWNWVRTECKLSDASDNTIWRPWESENHDAQRNHACWAGAELLALEDQTHARIYEDGSNPSQQQTAWSAYFKKFIQEHAKSGVAVEIFSPTYSKYFLTVFYNLFDFSTDDELHALAEDFLTLWWGLWAQEQIQGSHGGSKMRAYTGLLQGVDPSAGLSWYYTGLGRRPKRGPHPAILPAVTSWYRIPEIILEIMHGDNRLNGEYEVWTRQIGLANGPKIVQRYRLSSSLDYISRYSYVTPDYVMGANLVPRLRSARWAAISSQNRWSGLVFLGASDGWVYALPVPQRGRSTYNAVLATQSRGTQIVQRLPPPYSRNAGDMEIWIGPSLHRLERGGWIFVEGSAFVAARPAFGGYVADPSGASYRLLDQRSPVIIQAGTRTAYASFEAFQAAVLAAPLRVSPDSIEFEGLDGAGRLRFFLEGDRPAERDGRPIQAPPEWSLYSPFIRQRRGDSTVEITKGERRLVLRFDGSHAH